MADFDLLGFAQHCAGMSIKLDHALEHAVERAAVILESSAKNAIGTYEFDWPELAEATKQDRASKGFAPNEPELRTGSLRDSIQHTVQGAEGAVGSNHPVFPFQEFGTSKIPPRPILGGALSACDKDLGNVVASTVADAFRLSD